MAATFHPPSSGLFLGKCQTTAEEINALISWRDVFSSGSQQVNGWTGSRNELSCAQLCPLIAISLLYFNKHTIQPPGRACGGSFTSGISEMRQSRLQRDKNCDLCAFPVIHTTVLGVISGAVTIRCQNLLNNYQPLSFVRSMEQLPEGERWPVPGCSAHEGSTYCLPGVQLALEHRRCISQQVNKQILALTGNRLLFNKELLKSCLSLQGESALRYSTEQLVCVFITLRQTQSNTSWKEVGLYLPAALIFSSQEYQIPVWKYLKRKRSSPVSQL